MKAVSKGQIVPKYSDLQEDYICKISLSKKELTIERDECARDIVTLYKIPFDDIIDIDFVNGDTQSERLLGSISTNILGAITLTAVGIGRFEENKQSDIVRISFRDSNKTAITLTFDMLDYGEGGLSKKFQR